MGEELVIRTDSIELPQTHESHLSPVLLEDC